VHGRIVDASGRALADVSVELRDADETSVMATDTTTQSGSFDFGALSPRSYSLIARSSAPLRRASQPCEILADESFAIGDLVLQEPAILDIELVRSDGSAWRGMRPDVFFRDRDGYSSPLQFEPSPQGFRAIVEPGEFRLSVGEPDLVADPVSVQLAPADNQTVRLVVTIASRRDLVFAGDQAVKIDSKDVLNVTVTARDGTEFHKQLRRSPHGDGDWTLEHPFAIGNYTVSAVTDSGRRYAVTFEVTETIGEAHRIQVPLQN